MQPGRKRSREARPRIGPGAPHRGQGGAVGHADCRIGQGRRGDREGLGGLHARNALRLGGKTDDGTVQSSSGHRSLVRCRAEGIDAAITGGDPVALAVRCGRQCHHAAGAAGGRCRTVEGGVAEGEDPAVGGHQPVALAVRTGRHAHDWLVEMEVAGRTVEGGVAEGEDPAVGGHQPVALAVRTARHAHDRLVEMEVAGRAVEGGVAEGEDPAVGGHQPVALTIRGDRHAHDRLVQVDPTGRAEVAGIAEGEDAAVGGHQPVALTIRGDRHAHDRLVQVDPTGRAEVAGIAEGEDAAVGSHQPVALTVHGGRMPQIGCAGVRINAGRVDRGPRSSGVGLGRRRRGGGRGVRRGSRHGRGPRRRYGARGKRGGRGRRGVTGDIDRCGRGCLRVRGRNPTVPTSAKKPSTATVETRPRPGPRRPPRTGRRRPRFVAIPQCALVGGAGTVILLHGTSCVTIVELLPIFAAHDPSSFGPPTQIPGIEDGTTGDPAHSKSELLRATAGRPQLDVMAIRLFAQSSLHLAAAHRPSAKNRVSATRANGEADGRRPDRPHRRSVRNAAATIDRRRFLKGAGIGGLAVVIGPTLWQQAGAGGRPRRRAGPSPIRCRRRPSNVGELGHRWCRVATPGPLRHRQGRSGLDGRRSHANVRRSADQACRHHPPRQPRRPAPLDRLRV